MKNRLRFVAALALICCAALIVPSATGLFSPPTLEVIASGLDNPRGLAFGPDGALYVAEAGRGGDGACVTNGENLQVCYGASGAVTRIGPFSTSRVISRLPSLAPAPGQPNAGSRAAGVDDVAFDRYGRGVAVIGFGANPALRATLGAVGVRFGRLVRFGLFQSLTFDAKLADYEQDNNPDGGAIDTNPFGIALDGGNTIVADAGANAVLNVAVNGAITTLGVLPNKLVPFGPPGNVIPMQGVPTSVALGPDGAVYVGQLTGFPFPPGGASVFRITPGGAPEEFATGFTNIIDLTFGRDGSLYVLQISAAGLLSGNPVGKLVKVAPDGTRTEIAAGTLIAPGGVAIRGDSIYVSRFATFAGAGDVVRIRQ